MSCKQWNQKFERAIKSNNLKEIDEMLSKNSKLLSHFKSTTGRFFLLTRAIDCKNEEIVELIVNFLSKFDDLGTKKQDLQEFLRTAIQNNNLKLTELLLKKGAKLTTPEWQDTVLVAYRIFHRNNRKELLKLLVDHGLNVRIRNKDGRSLLRLFIGHVKKSDLDVAEMVEIFINSGVSANELDHFGITPLQHAVANGNIDLISCLIDRGANVNGKDKANGTALHTACRKHNLEAINLLIRKGAEISAVNNQGETPFYQLWDYGDDRYEPCLKAMVRQFAKLQAFENIPVFHLDLKVIQLNPRSMKYFEECLTEFERTSRTKF